MRDMKGRTIAHKNDMYLLRTGVQYGEGGRTAQVGARGVRYEIKWEKGACGG